MRGRVGNIAVAEAGSREGGASHLKLADDNAEDGAEHSFFADSGVDLARRLEQRLQAGDLLLQIDGLVVAGQMNACCHNFYLKLAGNLTLSRPAVRTSMAFF